MESTYGVSKHLPRDQREQRFIEKVRGILVRGGRVLLPVVALGRAQVLSDSLSGSLDVLMLPWCTRLVLRTRHSWHHISAAQLQAWAPGHALHIEAKMSVTPSNPWNYGLVQSGFCD